MVTMVTVTMMTISYARNSGCAAIDDGGVLNKSACHLLMLTGVTAAVAVRCVLPAAPGEQGGANGGSKVGELETDGSHVGNEDNDGCSVCGA